MIRVGVRCGRAGTRCPGCGSWSERVHGTYLRFPADLPVAGRRVVLRLRIRRFICEDMSCGRRTFVEQVEGLNTATVLVLSAGQFSGAVSASFVVTQAGLILASSAPC
ncbi:transposase family protein [Streptomyces sp. V3I8]|uniref:transposase family protein n=1 Tax=Streptomyces sp. V3I8 TaxID=3042279 RepID=UPI0027D8A11E|nr:transposase family protein [Streptomyces sp. V3I8]